MSSYMREIVFDTETTGLSAANGDRIIEIGCVELWNRIPTGKNFHIYLNPERQISQSAIAVHGLTLNFLKDKPKFADISDKLLNFFQDSPLVAHNATFDVTFLNHEFSRLHDSQYLMPNKVIDTLKVAKKKFPRAPASLDALCKRFNIDLKKRSKHGALLDAELLAKVYLELLGGAQTSILQNDTNNANTVSNQNLKMNDNNLKNFDVKDEFLIVELTEEQIKKHKQTLSCKIPDNLFYKNNK